MKCLYATFVLRLFTRLYFITTRLNSESRLSQQSRAGMRKDSSDVVHIHMLVTID